MPPTLAANEAERCRWPDMHCTSRYYQGYWYCYDHAVEYNHANGGNLAPITRRNEVWNPPSPPPPKKYIYEYRWEAGQTITVYNERSGCHAFEPDELAAALIQPLRKRAGCADHRGLKRLRYEKRGDAVRGPLHEDLVMINEYGRLPKTFSDGLPVPKHFHKQLAEAVASGIGGPWKKVGEPEPVPKAKRVYKKKIQMEEVSF